MLLFWIFGSIMILAALLLVVPPLMQVREDSGESTADANVSLYRDRLADLDRSLDEREIDPDRYAALREDLERGLLADVGGPAAPRVGARPPPYWMAVAVAVLVPVGSLAFYLAVGSPHRLDAQPPASDTVAAAQPPASDTVAAAQQTASVEAMVDALAAKLARDPADGEGWLLLARSQVVLERFDEAIAGFERARGLLGDTPDLLVDWAEAEAGLAGNRFTANALDRLERGSRDGSGPREGAVAGRIRRGPERTHGHRHRALGAAAGIGRNRGRERHPSSPRCWRGSGARPLRRPPPVPGRPAPPNRPHQAAARGSWSRSVSRPASRWNSAPASPCSYSPVRRRAAARRSRSRAPSWAPSPPPSCSTSRTRWSLHEHWRAWSA